MVQAAEAGVSVWEQAQRHASHLNALPQREVFPHKIGDYVFNGYNNGSTIAKAIIQVDDGTETTVTKYAAPIAGLEGFSGIQIQKGNVSYELNKRSIHYKEVHNADEAPEYPYFEFMWSDGSHDSCELGDLIFARVNLSGDTFARYDMSAAIPQVLKVGNKDFLSLVPDALEGESYLLERELQWKIDYHTVAQEILDRSHLAGFIETARQIFPSLQPQSV